MSARERIHRYRMTGGASDLVRIEVLVPPDNRSEIIEHAARLRSEYRERKLRLQRQIDDAYAHYGARLADNIDLSRIPSLADRARVIGKALVERGDARAFAMGRQLLAEVE